MPPTLALFLTLGFIGFLFRRDFREKPDVTGALWLPIVWLLIISSRSVSQWLNIFGLTHSTPISMEDGSPLDATVYVCLIAAGIYTLHRRRVALAEFARANKWLIAFFIYGLISIAWSDFPFVSFKRWIKILGHPIMVLIIFTEPDPQEAFRRLMKRCAYVIVPVSILLIKYYPEIGRKASAWATSSMNTGIAGGKNALGGDCLVLGLFFFWHLLVTWRLDKGKVRRNELVLITGFLSTIGWLLLRAQSSTALASLLLGMLVVLLLGLRSVNKKLIGRYVLVVVVSFLIAEATFGISSILIESLGRDSTLTGRTELWQRLLAFHTNPIYGVGFESFWLGERLLSIGEVYWWQANEAHNGYLETYLNLGWIGVFLMVAWIVATFHKSRLDLLTDFQFSRFQLGFLCATVIYNLAESGFRSLHPMWFVFYIVSVTYPQAQFESVELPLEMGASEREREAIYAKT